jgi:hypothetical protein
MHAACHHIINLLMPCRETIPYWMIRFLWKRFQLLCFDVCSDSLQNAAGKGADARSTRATRANRPGWLVPIWIILDHIGNDLTKSFLRSLVASRSTWWCDEAFVDAFNLHPVKTCVIPKIWKPRTMPENLQLQIVARNVNSHHRWSKGLHER